MTQPNSPDIMADRLVGTFFPDEPAGCWHAQNQKSLADPADASMESAAKATRTLSVSLRIESPQYRRSKLDPGQLFDLDDNRNEQTNLAQGPVFPESLECFQIIASNRLNLDAYDAAIRESQAHRWWLMKPAVNADTTIGTSSICEKTSDGAMRNHMDLND